jgi:hypothetical protein
MAKVIDLMSNREKIKVSLALNKETVELIDNAVNGFRAIYTLIHSRGELGTLNSSRSNSNFNNVISRSEILDEFVVSLSTEKVFKVKENIYSIVELSEMFEKFCLDFSLYGNIQISDYLKVKDPSETFRYYISVEKLQESIADILNLCRDDTWEMTLVYYPDLFEEIEFELKENVDFSINAIAIDSSIWSMIDSIRDHLNFSSKGRNAVYEKESIFKEMLAFVLEHQKVTFTDELRARILRNLLFEESNDTNFNVVEEAYSMRNCVDKDNYMTFTAVRE